MNADWPPSEPVASGDAEPRGPGPDAAGAARRPPGGSYGPRGQASNSTVTVTGVGEVSVTPDALSLELSVEATDAGVAAALSGARAGMAEVRRVMSSAGVAEADQRTSGLNIWPDHDDRTGVQRGYRAHESLTVLLRRPDLVDVVLVGATEAVGDLLRVGGLSFSVTEPSGAQDEARRLALAEARRRAELYAAELGRPLGRLRRLVEGRGGGGEMHDRIAWTAQSKSMEPGTQLVSVHLSAEWEIEQPRRDPPGGG